MKLDKLSFYTLLLVIPLSSAHSSNEEPGFSWGVGLSAIADDNIYRVNDSDASSDSIVALTPHFSFDGLAGKHKIQLSYDGKYGYFDKNSGLDFTNHNAKLHTLLDLTYRINTEFSLGINQNIEDPGLTNSAPKKFSEYTTIEDKFALANFYYGNFESTGQLVLGLKQNQLKHKNNQQSFRDMDRTNISLAFFYRVAPKSRMLLETRLISYDYEFVSDRIDQSSEQHELLAGYEWQATGKTTSVIKVGYFNRSFDFEEFDDTSGLSYYVDLYWRPTTRTLISVGGSRNTIESADNAIKAYVGQSASIGIKHKFTELTSVAGKYQLQQNDISSNSDRTDKIHKISSSVDYQLRDWLTISLAYNFNKRHSSEDLYQFDMNTISASLSANF